MTGQAVAFDGHQDMRVEAAYAPIRRLFETSRDFVVSHISVTAPNSVWLFTPEGDCHQLAAEEASFATLAFFQTLCSALSDLRGAGFSADNPVLRCDGPDGRRFRCVLGAGVSTSIAVSVSDPSRIDGQVHDETD